MKNVFYLITGIINTLSLSYDCTVAAERNFELERAACKAQSYLSRNGYLDYDPHRDTKEIELELWDRMQYEKDGKINWFQLLKDRANAFSQKMYAIDASIDGYLVYYKIEDSDLYACVSVSLDFDDAYLHEANCRPSGKATPILEDDLACSK